MAMATVVAAQTTRKTTKAAKAYKLELYFWLADFWEECKGGDGDWMLEGTRELCEDLFIEGEDPFELVEQTGLEDLERAREMLLKSIWRERNGHEGELSNWPWRTTPPTKEKAVELFLSKNFAIQARDVLRVSANHGGSVYGCRQMEITDSIAVEVCITAGASREHVLASLLDIIRGIQTDWNRLLKESPFDDPGEKAERAKWAKTLAPVSSN